jgi:hypothetical protein
MGHRGRPTGDALQAPPGDLDVAGPRLVTEFLSPGLHGVLVAATHQPRSQRERLVAGVTELMCRALGVRAEP